VNRYTDLSHTEYKQSIKGYSKGMKTSYAQRNLQVTEHETPTKEQMASIPETVDWRNEDVITPVKD